MTATHTPGGCRQRQHNGPACPNCTSTKSRVVDTRGIGGRVEVQDVKGAMTQAYRLKKKLLAAQGVEIVEVRA